MKRLARLRSLDHARERLVDGCRPAAIKQTKSDA